MLPCERVLFAHFYLAPISGDVESYPIPKATWEPELHLCDAPLILPIISAMPVLNTSFDAGIEGTGG